MRDWAADLHLMYFVAGTMALGFALASRRIRRWPISEPLLALVAGVLIGPVVLGLMRVDEPVLQPLLL